MCFTLHIKTKMFLGRYFLTILHFTILTKYTVIFSSLKAIHDIDFYGGPQLSRLKQNARVKSKTLTSKAKQSRQKQNHRVKSKTVASKAKRLRQRQNNRIKSQTLASKLSEHSECEFAFILFSRIRWPYIYLNIFDIFV